MPKHIRTAAELMTGLPELISVSARPAAPTGEAISAELVRDMLHCIDPSCDRLQWLAPLAAMKFSPIHEDEDGSVRRELAQAWSQGEYWPERPENYDSDDAFGRDYDSLKDDGRANFGTLVARARAGGYDGPISVAEAERREQFRQAGERLGAEMAAGDTAAENSGRRTVQLIGGNEAMPTKIDWLWPGWLARGKLHVFGGGKGAGKSTLVFELFAALTRGGKWPDGTQAPLGDVLIWSAEDDFADTILPRFLIAGGDPERLHYVRGVTDADGTTRPFDPAVDMPALLEVTQGLPKLVAAMIDPVVSAVAGDSHKNAETRRGLQPLVDFAEARQLAVLGITHFTKGTQGRDPIERITGSLAFGALARIVWGASIREDDTRRFVRIASNIGPSGGGFEYRLRQQPLPGHDFTAQRVVWGKHLTGSARELLDDEQKGGSETFKAIAFLTELLTEAGSGGLFVTEVKQAAIAETLSWRTIERAKEKMGNVRSKARPGSMPPKWVWILETVNMTGGDDDLPF